MEASGEYKRYIQQPDESQLEELFGTMDADIILYGHDHTPYSLKGKRTYINTGSLGCPARDKNIARAGVLAIGEVVTYDSVQIEYDVESVVREIENLQYPDYKNIEKYFYGV